MNEKTEIYLRSRDVRARYGGASDMWIYRRVNDPQCGFPKPIKLGRLRYWKLSDLEEWERRRAFPSPSAA